MVKLAFENIKRLEQAYVLYRFHLVDGFRTQFHFRTEYSVLDTKIWFSNENAL